MDIANLMWDETARDYDAEQRETSRTAALADAERLVGEYVYRATSDVDLAHRLALAESQLQAIATQRLYPVNALNGDLRKRWRLLSQARAAAEAQEAQQRTASQRTAAAEQAMDVVTARLAALAARENPGVPVTECLKLATEAVRKHADAYPLAYESWGGAADGPITDRAKHFQPGGMPKGNTGQAADPGPNGGAGTFDDVHKRLDDLDNRLGPSSSTTAALDPVTAGMWQRLKDWWQGGDNTPSSAPAAAAPTPAAVSEPEHVGPYDPTGWHGGAPARHAEDLADQAAERAHDQAGRREYDDIMRRLDNDQAEMSRKWDTPRSERFESTEDTNQRTKYLQDAHDRRSSDMEQRLDSLSDSLKPSPPSTPASGFSHAERPQITNVPLHDAEPPEFSHADAGTAPGGQQTLPTDPADHGFSHRASLQTALFE
ncbi:hypothetical protein ACPCSE_29510 [Streptomyces cellulosae]